jgi:endonuclease G
MKLVKAGAFSGFTHAIVDGIEGSYEMNYSGYGDDKRWMDGIRLKRDPSFPEQEISIAGDSGSVWLNPTTGRAVALHFAGEDDMGPSEEYALAHPIRRVLDLLNIQLS